MSRSMSSMKRVLTMAAFGLVVCGPTHFAFAGDDPPKAARDELKSRQARIEEQVTEIKALSTRNMVALPPSRSGPPRSVRQSSISRSFRI